MGALSGSAMAAEEADANGPPGRVVIFGSLFVGFAFQPPCWRREDS